MRYVFETMSSSFLSKILWFIKKRVRIYTLVKYVLQVV